MTDRHGAQAVQRVPAAAAPLHADTLALLRVLATSPKVRFRAAQDIEAPGEQLRDTLWVERMVRRCRRARPAAAGASCSIFRVTKRAGLRLPPLR